MAMRASRSDGGRVEANAAALARIDPADEGAAQARFSAIAFAIANLALQYIFAPESRIILASSKA